MPASMASDTLQARPKSFVQAYPAKPKGVSLAIAIASSSVLNDIIGMSGPKVSCLKGSISVVAPVTTVGSKKHPLSWLSLPEVRALLRATHSCPPVVTVPPLATQSATWLASL
eukprot:CAMPEP_0170071484 /NCGR_PEP_ID=MMETSP0019_2-20121128/9403_1 /TAXON_ID=98059 /ORGANISM="Dinobryon sp., Strain UTEXLB2267" /LENGTH=112 /DNA_ID=CAMNT_0010280063 /DNA_START=131 /DNA_END=466 /DNA_ORIENTATION=+